MRRVWTAAIAALLVASTMYRLPGATIGRGNMEWVAVLGVTIGICWWIGHKVSPWLGLILALATWYHWWPRYDHIGYTTLHNLIIGAVTVFIVSRHPETHQGLKWGMCLTSLVLLASMFKDGNAMGRMCNQNEAGALFAYCLPATLDEDSHRRLFAPVIAVGIVAAASFGGALAAAVGVTAWLVLSGRLQWWQAAALAITGLACHMVFFDKPETSVRLLLWREAIGSWSEHWQGWGLGRWTTIAGKYHTGPHNEYLRLLVEMGPLVLLLLAGFFYECWRRYRTALTVQAIGLIVAATHGVYSFEWHIGPTALVLALWLGMYLQPGKAVAHG